MDGSTGQGIKGTTSMVSITRTTLKEKMYGILIFAGGILFVYYAYKFFNTKITYITYIDSLNTALFFVAMWYMALKNLKTGHCGLPVI